MARTMDEQERDGPPSTVWAALLVGLIASGVAGILNQVLWQRALKIFLGGSETLSAMVVVLVFLLGLGIGSAVASRVAPRLGDPMRALCATELGLALVNAGVAGVLGLDITETVYAVQRLAVSGGVPLRLVYAVGSAVLLLLPTMAMGATVPLAAEACQRQLRAQTSRLVPALLFVNTVGAALGAYAASAWLLPALGQRRALLVAVACNALAALVIGLGARVPPAAVLPPSPGRIRGRLTREEVLGGVLGLLSLGYEMVLFRILVLSHQPLPTTFATGLAAFLLAWSLGLALSDRLDVGVPTVAAATGIAVVCAPVLYALEREIGGLPLGLAVGLYVLPCVGFGALYGHLVSRGAREWGRDVGRYAAVNTLGSCAGILFFTLVGYEMPQVVSAVAIAVGLGALAVSEAGSVVGAGLVALAAAAVLAVGWQIPYTEHDGARTYWGRDGVVEVMPDGDVHLDGLWHTRLSDGADHVGHPYTWLMAFAAAMAHENPSPTRGLVVGAGVGISSVCLTGIEGLSVDGYEINHTLRRVLEDYPEQTLNSAKSPAIRWIWQDARTGMALDPTRYDIILSAPLYLRQAGASLLLSREYLRLVKSRLAPDGVLAVYSNEGSPAQTRLVQSTLAELFAYRVTWNDGVVTVASDHPMTLTRRQLHHRLQRPDRLYREAAALDASLADAGGLFGWYDGEAYAEDVADRVITDDQPLIEYPELAERWVR